MKALLPPPVRHPKLGPGHAMEVVDDKVRVLFEDGTEKTIKRSFLQWDE